jgi:hypothetical protein
VDAGISGSAWEIRPGDSYSVQGHGGANVEWRMQNEEWRSRPEIDWYFGTRKKKYHDCNSL